jgi:hypothetical protein
MITIAIRLIGVEAFVAALIHVVVVSVLTATANAEASTFDGTILVTMDWASTLGFSLIDIACTVLVNSSRVTTR